MSTKKLMGEITILYVKDSVFYFLFHHLKNIKIKKKKTNPSTFQTILLSQNCQQNKNINESVDFAK